MPQEETAISPSNKAGMLWQELMESAKAANEALFGKMPIAWHHRQLLNAWLSLLPGGWYSIPKPQGSTRLESIHSKMLIDGITEFLVEQRGLLECCTIAKVVWQTGSFIGKLHWCGLPFETALRQATSKPESLLWPSDVEPLAIDVKRTHCLVRKNPLVDFYHSPSTIEQLNSGEFYYDHSLPYFERFSECDRANEEGQIRRAVKDNPSFITLIESSPSKQPRPQTPAKKRKGPRRTQKDVELFVQSILDSRDAAEIERLLIATADELAEWIGCNVKTIYPSKWWTVKRHPIRERFFQNNAIRRPLRKDS